MTRLIDLRAVAARAGGFRHPDVPTHVPIAPAPRQDDDRARQAARSAAVAATQRLVGGYVRT